METEKIFLKGCMGSGKAGNNPNHIFGAYKDETFEEIPFAWLTFNQAVEQFGADNVVDTKSTTRCKPCTVAERGRKIAEMTHGLGKWGNFAKRTKS